MNLKLVYSILLLFIFSATNAQNVVNYNMWYQYLMSSKINDKLSLTISSQYRSYDLLLDSRLFLFSSYVDYSLNKKLNIGGGAMFLVLNSYGKNGIKKERYEKRLFQQITINDKIGRTTLSHRFRVEERFLDNPTDFIVRLRYLASLRIPFNKPDEKQISYGILKNEIRIAVVKDKPFDSNRLTFGVGFNLSKKSAIEINLINQLSDHKTSNYLFIGFRNKFDWSKKKIDN